MTDTMFGRRPGTSALAWSRSDASVLILNSGNEKALFAGDILHTPLQVSHPDFDRCFCEDLATARATRRDLLGWAPFAAY
jgi:hypothetical protein